jgi:hypothetical protein
MSARVKHFRAHYCMRSKKSAISLSMDGCAFPTVGSLVIVFQVRNSVRPMHLFGPNRDHDYYFKLLGEEEQAAQSYVQKKADVFSGS